MVVLPPSAEPPEWNVNYVFYWNSVALDLIRLTTTVRGPLRDPPGSSRALGMLHLAIHDAFFAIEAPQESSFVSTYLSSNSSNPQLRLPELQGAYNSTQAVAGAAIMVLQVLFTSTSTSVGTPATGTLSAFLQQQVATFPGLDTSSPSYAFGGAVGTTILNYLNDPSVFNQGNYTPEAGQYKFSPDPTNPVALVPVDVNNPDGPTEGVEVYDAPYYGASAKRLAMQGIVNGQPTQHILGDPPVGFSVEDRQDYDFAFDEILRLGGAFGSDPPTRRAPAQTSNAYFWAYDNTNLIGTPLRNYNQILRQIAWSRKPGGATDSATNADFIRLFALVNVAGADAALQAWQEKWQFSFWRPLPGVRQDGLYGNPLANPFFLTVSTPETNSNSVPSKPPFPSYPSGHATIGSAIFQMMRLYYKRRDNLDFPIDGPDNLAFTAGSDELNGISRDLRVPYDPDLPITQQLGTVRTKVNLSFTSLWDAIFQNAISRIYLGVHWHFDAFSPKDTLLSYKANGDGSSKYRNTSDIRYNTFGPRGDRPGLFPLGGVPLGIGIANDIFQSNLKPAAASQQPPFTPTT